MLNQCGEMVDEKDIYAQEIADDKYIAYECSVARTLHQKLPRYSEDLEDLIALMRMYAIEATTLFIPGKVKFFTFMHKHLRIRSMSYLNSAWLKKKHPTKRLIQTFSVFHNEEGEDLDPSVDEQDSSLEVQELINNLSEESQKALRILLASLEPLVLKAFAKSNFAITISRLVPLSIPQTRTFVDEVQSKAHCYLSSLTL